MDRKEAHKHKKQKSWKTWLIVGGFNVGKLWAIDNLPEYLHGIDRQADELYETMYAKLSKDARYERVSDFMENYRRQTEIQRLIEEEILNELVYVD